ncbi:MAG: PEP-CTERM sorting domain-containing protein, partial [Planctomycetota bacterium]
ALVLGAAVLIPNTSTAQVEIIGGATSVALDTDTLAAAASLTLSSVSPGIGAGTLPGAVAFPINARDAASLPTTFAFTPGDFPSGSFSGTIEHTGSVFFNSDTVEVGNFTIAFDANRVGGNASGFFVSSTTGTVAPLFDTAVVALGAADESKLDLTVDLLVAPEFAQFLLDNSLASTNLTGADVGDARILAAVPEPTTLAALMLAAIGGLSINRRR